MNNPKYIRSILVATRREIANYVSKRNLSNSHDLVSMCGVSSFILFRLFKEMGYRPTFCMNDGHCFITVGDYWVDLTLKQFDERLPFVYIQKRPCGAYHKAEDKGKTLRKVRRMFRGWPPEQNPFRLNLNPVIKALDI